MTLLSVIVLAERLDVCILYKCLASHDGSVQQHSVLVLKFVQLYIYLISKFSYVFVCCSAIRWSSTSDKKSAGRVLGEDKSHVCLLCRQISAAFVGSSWFHP